MTPFDQLAPQYAQLWSDTDAGRSQRSEVWRHIQGLFATEGRVLDLGCGIGDDAVHLAEQGIAVLGVDASGEMVEAARDRGVTAHKLAIEQISTLGGPFTGALSNFGALNCVEDLSGVARQLAALLPTGAPFALSVMGRFSAAESLRYLLRGDVKRATRRWSGRAEWRGITVYYRSARDPSSARPVVLARTPGIYRPRGSSALHLSKVRRMTTLTARHQFLEDYRRIRSAEGRGSPDSLYYRKLPFHDDWHWQMRARTFRYFVRHILPTHPCDILDLGAGNCWLSYRLREMHHRPVAVDIFSDPLDGLASARHYPVSFPAIESDFNNLPFPARSFDLAVFNASIHYSSDYRKTLTESKRLLRPGGRVVILDSPVYAQREHGERMRAERQAQFQQQYGFRSEALGSIEFFDQQMLRDLARDLGMRWEIHRPWYGLQWHMRPLRARLKGQRPPSRFWILVGHFA